METGIGHVTHYYKRLGVAVLCLIEEIKVNDLLHFSGLRTDFYQKAWSMEMEHRSIQCAGSGCTIAIKVAEPVHRNDRVFRVVETTPEELDGILMQQLREWEGKT